MSSTNKLTNRALLCGLVAVVLNSHVAFAQETLETDADTVAEGQATQNQEFAKERKLSDRIQAVERKFFLKRSRFELYPYFGFDINDPFFQHLFVGASLSYHVADSLAIEARGGYVVAAIEKDVIRFTQQATESLLSGEPKLVMHADAALTWSPIYGKFSLFGESIIHFDTYLSGGGGVMLTERREGSKNVSNTNPAANVAIGQRYFINRWLTFRWELRNYTFLEEVPIANSTESESNLRNTTVIGISLSGFLPTSFEYEYQ